MSREIFQLTDTTGATRFLSLSTNTAALYSVDGVAWVPVYSTSVPGSDPGTEDSYVFGYGLVLSSGIVSVDSSIVPTLTAGKLSIEQLPDEVVVLDNTGKISPTQLPAYPLSYGAGLALTDSLQLTVTAPNIPGNIVVLPAGGVLPAEILPLPEYGRGLDTVDGVVVVDVGERPSQIVSVGDDGKISPSLIPEPPQYSGGIGIEVQENVISEIWKDYR